MTTRARCPICGSAAGGTVSGRYDDRYGYPTAFELRNCRSCGHHFVVAAFTPAELAELYTNYYPRSTRAVADIAVPAQSRAVASWLNGEGASAFRSVPAGVRVLDIGCGFGESLLYHEARGSDAWGIDVDENLQRVADAFGLNVKVGLFRAEDWPSASFDYVTLDQVIEHAENPIRMLRDVRTVLKPGGIAIVSTPNARGMWARVFGRRWINWHIPYHLHHFSRRSLQLAARRAGLEPLSIRTLTNSAWLEYQFLHVFSVPQRGDPSPFWAPERSSASVPMPARVTARILLRARVFSILTRLVDAAGHGDNLLVFLRAPAE